MSVKLKAGTILVCSCGKLYRRGTWEWLDYSFPEVMSVIVATAKLNKAEVIIVSIGICPECLLLNSVGG